jgi:predicted ATPase
MKITKVRVNRYKSYEIPQEFTVDPAVTVLVGKNEAGKTAILEAVAKTKYFTDDKNFKFDPVHDYPRKEKKKYDKSGVVEEAIQITYAIDPALRQTIEADVGKGVLSSDHITLATKYDNSQAIYELNAKTKTFLEHKAKVAGIVGDHLSRLLAVKNVQELDALKATVAQEHSAAEAKQKTENEGAPDPLPVPPLIALADKLRPYFLSKLDWENRIEAYIWENYLRPALPKFLYYSEYYALPSRINIEDLQAENLEDEHLKTSKALFELADLNVKEVTSSGDFERFVSELEATGNEVTQQLQKYWTTNPDLRIRFQIDKQHVSGSQYKHILDIRVENLRHMVTLPLRNRSKGFNWFFSFIVWFSKIQEDTKSNYVILLDEPGLNLHASAQEDLLRFIDDLSKRYQVMYTTHSPFMVESEKLSRVRTIYEGKDETQITDAIQQRDADTLFPLQAALGYDIAQNLFISKYNLLVEGPADLVFLTMMSAILEAQKRKHLRDDVTIVPVGGLDKVTTFISLLRATKLSIVCLLDAFTDPSGKQKVQDLIRDKIIREKNVRFFDEFASVSGGKADLEDMFDKPEYLRFFNGAFPEFGGIGIGDLSDPAAPLIPQINAIIKRPRYNHYRPAAYASAQGLDAKDFSAGTLDRFEKMFEEVNSRF